MFSLDRCCLHVAKMSHCKTPEDVIEKSHNVQVCRNMAWWKSLSSLFRLDFMYLLWIQFLDWTRKIKNVQIKGHFHTVPRALQAEMMVGIINNVQSLALHHFVIRVLKYCHLLSCCCCLEPHGAKNTKIQLSPLN